jgi:hypothetical protein
MRRRTTTALALAGAALTLPGAAFAATAAIDPPSPVRTALRAPLAGHLTVASQMRAERAANVREDLTRRVVREARKTARVSDEKFSAGAERRRVRGSSAGELRERIRELRRDRRQARREAREAREARKARKTEAAAASTASPALQAIAACESGGNPATNTGNGFYGKYQFTLSTWASVGGSGNPAAASEAEQDKRAAILYARAGASPWPTCGR